jgi:hypothetical protein
MELPRLKFSTLSTCSLCKIAPNLIGEFGVHYEFTDMTLLEGEERIVNLASSEVALLKTAFGSASVKERGGLP